MCYYRHYSLTQCGHHCFGANVTSHCSVALEQMDSIDSSVPGAQNVEDSTTPPTTPIVGKFIPRGSSIQVSQSYPSSSSSSSSNSGEIVPSKRSTYQLNTEYSTASALPLQASPFAEPEICRKQRHGYRSLNVDGLCLKCKRAQKVEFSEKESLLDGESAAAELAAHEHVVGRSLTESLPSTSH